jgi:hypothetical protein
MMNRPEPSLKPVLRKPRHQWEIPTLPKREQSAELKALIAGTTPLAREILRKLFFGLEQRVEVNGEPLDQVAGWLENRLITFWALQPEFALLLSRLWGGGQEAWIKTSPRELAILLVLGTTYALRLKRTHAAAAARP